MRGDTRRWLESDLPEELQSVLRSATQDEASAAQLERLRNAVESAIGPAAFELQARPAEPAAVSGTPSTAPWANASQPLTSALPWALTAIAAIGLATLAARWTSAPDPVADAAPLVQAPSAPPPVIANQPEVPSAAPVVKQSKPQAAPRAASAPRPPAPRPTLAEELASLDRIRSQLQNPEQATVAMRRHAEQFREGALIPERQLLELEIALRTGQAAKAKRLSKPMLRENSTFPYRARALKLLSDFGY